MVGAGLERSKEYFVVGDIIFEVGILYQEDITRCVIKTIADRMTFAARDIFKDDFDMGQRFIAQDNRSRAIGGVALDDDNLDLPALDFFSGGRVEGGLGRRLFVKDWDDDR